MWSSSKVTPYILILIFGGVLSTNRYYGTYMRMGTGDTFIQTYWAQGGPNEPLRKWNIECLDGEAMVGLNDFIDDFFQITYLWCKFMFPYKPATNGLYPYYPSCHVRNITNQFYCFDPEDKERTVNTFVTGFRSPTLNRFFVVFRPVPDAVTPMKCCKTPQGYYIDYVSCYHMPTHDLYMEFYDSATQFLVQCAQGYVMTGASKKVNPYTREFHVVWIQCCRVGYGAPEAHRPPVTFTKSGAPVYTSPPNYTPIGIPPGYAAQYRKTEDDESDTAHNGLRHQQSDNATSLQQTLKMRKSMLEKYSPEDQHLSLLQRNFVSNDLLGDRMQSIIQKTTLERI